MLDAQQQVTRGNPDYIVDIHFEEDFFKDDNDKKLLITGNEYLLKVAFANLFENGCKFSNDKRSKVSISLKGNRISLDFSDNGIGIPKENLDTIFQPFFRGNNKDFSDGNGIGLTLTQKIIDLHKGSISVSSSKNEYTIFSVTLPIDL